MAQVLVCHFQRVYYNQPGGDNTWKSDTDHVSSDLCLETIKFGGREGPCTTPPHSSSLSPPKLVMNSNDVFCTSGERDRDLDDDDCLQYISTDVFYW